MSNVGAWCGFVLFFIAAIAIGIQFPALGMGGGIAVGIILPWVGYILGSTLDR